MKLPPLGGVLTVKDAFAQLNILPSEAGRTLSVTE